MEVKRYRCRRCGHIFKGEPLCKNCENNKKARVEKMKQKKKRGEIRGFVENYKGKFYDY